MQNNYVISNKTTAFSHKAINCEALLNLYSNYTFKTSTLQIQQVDGLVFKVGNATEIPLLNNDFVLNVEKGGIYLTASNEVTLKKGFIYLLNLIKFDNEVLYIPTGSYSFNPEFKTLMAHYCLFYDTKLYEFERFVKFIGALGYTHLILEFWGSYAYTCLSELGWKNAYTYSQIKPIINTANDLGIEVIPMFNHWGHATQSRFMHGKHVVLNQNPSLYYLFDDGGWRFNYKYHKVKTLLKSVRDELIALCGKGSYFHIGCDEAYGFDYSSEEINSLCNFVNETAKDLSLQGRKTIIWGDMLLCKDDAYNESNSYCVSAPNKEKQTAMINGIDKSIIIADWQYHAKNYPVETAISLKDAGFTVIICPWDRGTLETDACIETAKKHNLFGVMHTTWHTLTSGMPHVLRTAELVSGKPKQSWHYYGIKTASILRKAYPTSDYETAGFSPIDVGVLY